ncbi:SapC family protein [Shewanella decolorationis]|uniref:SapC family protein n=2 Tax=Shewanella decolorationis TaxID=256839 RepID=A0A5B8R077_9GAMM|nr:SapC family protein [Shewanella decolorationis]ESE40752.1 SapC family protein [Shewanella decolorationis S12]QDZ92005.1 SapC family protein [Shewanella decolorationis]GLR32253.1 SapC family protein [Shewanella decolorationis]
MKTQFVPLNDSSHKNLAIGDKVDYSYFETVHMLPLQVQEFMSAATSFPIVFTKNNQTGEFVSIAITALKPNTNKLLKNGQWQSRYLPIQVQLYPFGMSQVDEEKIILGIDINNSSVAENETHRLFTEAGEKTDYLSKKLELAGLQANYQDMTKYFIKVLLEHELLQPRTLTVTALDGTKTNIDGIYTIDEPKLQQLDDATLLNFAKRGFYSAIYAHLCSLSLIDLVMDR